MDEIRLEYMKIDEDEDIYKIYHNEKLLNAIIVVIHPIKDITFYRFLYENYNNIDRIAPKIFKLFEEYVLPEYKEYKIEYSATYGNDLYWKWKNNNEIRLDYIKSNEEEDIYKIYHNERLLNAEIVVSHVEKDITFNRFPFNNYNNIDRILLEIFKLFEEHVRPEYKEYKILNKITIGNELYWNWKNNNMETIK